MAYPQYRRNGNTFYKVIEEGLITKIEPDTAIEFYQYCGLTAESEGEVNQYDECSVQDWEDVCNDLKTVSRVGSRPSIPPPH